MVRVREGVAEEIRQGKDALKLYFSLSVKPVTLRKVYCAVFMCLNLGGHLLHCLPKCQDENGNTDISGM